MDNYRKETAQVCNTAIRHRSEFDFQVLNQSPIQTPKWLDEIIINTNMNIKSINGMK